MELRIGMEVKLKAKLENTRMESTQDKNAGHGESLSFERPHRDGVEADHAKYPKLLVDH